MIIPVFAIKNTFRAGIKSWLNAFVLSLSIVSIIWLQGLYKGMYDQGTRAMIDAELGGGQYWVEGYDPYDPFSIEDSHGKITHVLSEMIKEKSAACILVARGMLYKQGRMHSILIKGIDPEQEILSIPSGILKEKNNAIIPALIGTRMAKNSGLKKGDIFTVQWKDSKGVFDAMNFQVSEVMKTTVQNIDNNQIWISLNTMQKIFNMHSEATIVTIKKDIKPVNAGLNWEFKNLDFLLQDMKTLVQAKTAGASILYIILIFLAMIAVFDTQTLSIFKRKKEISTLIAMGMTKNKVIALFTLEGMAYDILAVIIAAIYGVPLLIFTAVKGWKMPAGTDTYGFALGDVLYPVYSLNLVFWTLLFVFILTAIVSYVPARKIAKIEPAKILRGSTF